jgi:hypothetical protein
MSGDRKDLGANGDRWQQENGYKEREVALRRLLFSFFEETKELQNETYISGRL